MLLAPVVGEKAATVSAPPPVAPVTPARNLPCACHGVVTSLVPNFLWSQFRCVTVRPDFALSTNP